jgi:S-DNA-T family DNA segregation ATPase FtsK/SpoIIIE
MTTRYRAKSSGGSSLANEVIAVLVVAAAVLLFLSLITYDPKDPSWNSVGTSEKAQNLIGLLGAYIADFLLQFFGLAALVIPVLMTLIAVRVFFSDSSRLPVRKSIGAAALLVVHSGFLALFSKAGIGLLERSRSNGGAVGYVVESSLAAILNTIGAAIVLAVASVLTLMLTMEISLVTIGGWFRSAKAARDESRKGKPTMFQRLTAWWAKRAEQRRLQAEEQEALRAEQERQKEEERRKREREAQALLAKQRKEIAEERKRQEEERKARAHETVIAEPIISSSVEEAIGELEPAVEADDELEPEIVEPRRVLSPTRSKMAEVLRARAAKAEQMKVAQAVASEIVMDPDVAEMTSTAWIERTAPAEKTEPTSGGAGAKTARRKAAVETTAGTIYKLPSLDLLEPPIGHHEQAEDELRERATILAEKCKEFSVTGHIHRINPGPVVTTFEFKPDPGIKYSRVVSLAEDLCLALKAESIRIDRIPGKSTVGIEVPNSHRATIYLREVIESAKFQNTESKLTIALGKTINGEEYVADLMKMPHLLIAGATGAGKSVTLNTIICSILYKASPEEVKFIMVDPKRLELGLYEGIPHLLTPIVTDPKRASNALKWAVTEMENRYRELATLGVRNIDQYNRQVREMTVPTLAEEGAEARKPLPYIVIAIDELADLMMVARGDVETSIARLAQMARAVGIHLVLATQRPSVDVITGVIKANFPSRIAFRVSSKVDSRTIIDSNGAEALLGQGDMLFLPPASARLIRVHGSFVNETEVKRITDHTRKQAEPDYNNEVTMSEQEAEGGDAFTGERDELYEEALQIVTDMGRASTSVLQRRLSIGYGRAAKILDMMEHEGFIGPAEGAKPRKVLRAAYDFRERNDQIIEEAID